MLPLQVYCHRTDTLVGHYCMDHADCRTEFRRRHDVAAQMAAHRRLPSRAKSRRNFSDFGGRN